MELPPMPMNPLVSVLIGNYNYAKYIGQAIDSVLVQDYQNFEICICDDGSTDQSVEVIERYASRDPRIKFVVQQNAGQGAALNSAWALAKGDVIALLDADDVWLPQKLKAVLNAFYSDQSAGLVAHRQTLVWGDLRIIRPQRFPEIQEGWLASRLMSPPGYVMLAACSGLTLRTEIARHVLPIDSIFRAHADSVIAERAVLLTIVRSIPEPLSLYRIHRGNITGGSGPRDLEAARRDIALFDARMADRRQFIRHEFGIEMPELSWTFGAELHLAVHLFLSQRPKSDLIDQVACASKLRKFMWQFLFSCPNALALRLLRLRGREQGWKHWLKFALHLPS